VRGAEARRFSRRDTQRRSRQEAGGGPAYASLIAPLRRTTAPPLRDAVSLVSQLPRERQPSATCVRVSCAPGCCVNSEGDTSGNVSGVVSPARRSVLVLGVRGAEPHRCGSCICRRAGGGGCVAAPAATRLGDSGQQERRRQRYGPPAATLTGTNHADSHDASRPTPGGE